MVSRMFRATIGLLTAWLAVAGCGPVRPSAEADVRARQALRLTAASIVWRQCADSVVTLGMRRPNPDKPKEWLVEYGTGIIIDESGHILTNAHFLRHGGEGAAGVRGDKDYPFTVVASDKKRDLAVLKIDAGRPLKPIRMGASRNLAVGERIVMIGSPFGMGLTVTEGIVTALGRSTKSEFTDFRDMIQISASPNPGMSGGPVLNVFGELVGVNTTWRAGANDIGFAIPVERVREALAEMMSAAAKK